MAKATFRFAKGLVVYSASIPASASGAFTKEVAMTIRGRNRGLCVPAGLLIVGTLAACTTSHVIVGHARAPISPEQVNVYLQPPARYEEVALVSSSSRQSFAITAQARTDKVVDRLKKEAASLGANGIVLREITDQSSGSVGSDFATAEISGSTTHAVGTGISATFFSKGGSATAIYVPAEAVSSR